MIVINFILLFKDVFLKWIKFLPCKIHLRQIENQQMNKVRGSRELQLTYMLFKTGFAHQSDFLNLSINASASVYALLLLHHINDKCVILCASACSHSVSMAWFCGPVINPKPSEAFILLVEMILKHHVAVLRSNGLGHPFRSD